MSEFVNDVQQEPRDDLQSIIADLREAVEGTEDVDVFDVVPRGQFLNRMDSFARAKSATVFDDEDTSEDVFSQPSQFLSKKIVFGANMSSVFDDEPEQQQSGLFDSFDVSQKAPTRKLFLDFERDVLGEDNDQPSLADTAGLDKLLEGRPSLRSVLGCGILSEQDLIRTNVLSHRSKEEVAAILAAVTPETMSFDEFLAKFTPLKEPMNDTRRFILSVIGPEGNGKPPPKSRRLDYIFYGNHRLDARCHQFFDDMRVKFESFPSFYGEVEERLDCARDHMEEYVMSEIADQAFSYSEEHDEDQRLSHRMKILSFLTPESLDIRPELFNKEKLLVAIAELKRINNEKTPGTKVDCVVSCVTLIFSSLSEEKPPSTETESTPSEEETTDAAPQMASADDFLPIFIWVVLNSHIPMLASNCAFIECFLNPARMISKAGYCLINLRSAINFIMNLDAHSVNMDPDLFAARLAEKEHELQPAPHSEEGSKVEQL